MQHNLKIERQWFEAVVSGAKKAEVRRTDRPFSVGDSLMLYVPGENDGVLVTVTHILSLSEIADLDGASSYAVLSFADPRPMSGQELIHQLMLGNDT
ncbi:MAG: DUF3850 domain-containing protein [Actinobacteria bacterium]|nr:DUF3850 domain-containing protein [Actinomycetota bacterium]